MARRATAGRAGSAKPAGSDLAHGPASRHRLAPHPPARPARELRLSAPRRRSRWSRLERSVRPAGNQGHLDAAAVEARPQPESPRRKERQRSHTSAGSATAGSEPDATVRGRRVSPARESSDAVGHQACRRPPPRSCPYVNRVPPTPSMRHVAAAAAVTARPRAQTAAGPARPASGVGPCRRAATRLPAGPPSTPTSASATPGPCRNRLGSARVRSAICDAQTNQGASTPRTLNTNSPRSTASSITVIPTLMPRATAWTARVAACLADAHAAASGSADQQRGADEPGRQLNPPPHLVSLSRPHRAR
jgi:hypothetical protein